MSETFEQRQQAVIDGRRRAILITGAASGMGLETSKLFSSKGWFIVALDVNVEDAGTDSATGRARPGLKSLEKTLGGPENVYIRQVDVSKKEEFDAVIADLEDKLPKLCGSEKATLDAVFANAGIGRGGMWALQDFKDHMDVVGVNFIGVMVTIYGALKLMKENPGALVFSTSSSSAMYGSPGIATYAATKHAVKGLTEALSIELGVLYKIRVSDTLPGLINTPILPSQWANSAPKEGPWRLIEPVEIANAVWKSWLNDPEGKDELGGSTKDRIHWYIPEELIEEVDAIVNTRGGAEKVRETFAARFQPFPGST